jgi:ABC-type sugar transport system ATPase subunit
VIQFESVSLIQGAHHLTGITFEVPEGDYAVLMGPTGCGKTSVLELICGLRMPLSGKISIEGKDVTKLSPAARGIGYVPQDGALFPGLTVGEQVGFSLRVRKRPEEEIKARVILITDMLGITHLLNRRPEGLSGGERQRVALGRALAFGPRILCLDEPISALDEDLRADMCSLLKKVHAETGVTALHVTHSESEARELATLHLRFESGSIREVHSRSTKS